jgi:hypothetical protein
MNSYQYQPNVTESINGSYGHQLLLNPEKVAQFKSYVESHLMALTAEVQTLQAHANWIEPRLNDYHKFMEWMQRVHPDVITAYTEATKVEKTLDNALEGGEMAYPQAMSEGAHA